MKDEFSQIEVNPPTAAKRVTRKGKKSVPFTEDAEILKRLAKVAELMLQGTPAWRIAEELKCSIGTAKRDVRRVREIWRMEASEKLESLMGDALAQYQAVQKEAWKNAVKFPDRSSPFLAVILNAQEKIDKIGGLERPSEVKVQVDGTLEVRDIEKVRDERWSQVQGMLAEIMKKE